MSFQNILGQETAINRLRGYIEHSHLANGYLFCGPEGVGKRMAAITLAKAVNCESQTTDSCDKCPPCARIAANQHPDLHIIDAEDAERIKIENIRQLQREISLKPYEARKKVFIIDNAHQLTAEAAGALLKVLEEPPKDSLIILISAKPNLLFKTIVSRCRVVKFYPMARAGLEEALKKDYSLHMYLAHYLAYFCEGRIGNALTLRETDVLREKNMVINGFLFSRNNHMDDLAKADASQIRRYLNILAAWFRDAYLVQAGMDQSEAINFDRKSELFEFAGRFTSLELEEILKSISDYIFYLEHNINAKLLTANLRTQIWKE